MLESNIWENAALRPSSVKAEPDASDGLNHFLATARRHIKALAIWMAFCIGVAIAYVANVAPEFSAAAYVVLKPGQGAGTPLPSTAYATASVLDNAQLESQVVVVKSDNVLKFVFEERKLQDQPEFNRRISLTGSILNSIARLWSSSKDNVVPGADSAQRAADTPGDRAVDLAFASFASRVSARRVGQSYALEISVRSESATLAASLANSITASYIRDQIRATMLSMRATGTLFQGRSEDIRAQEEEITAAVRSGAPPNGRYSASDARVISSATVPFASSYPQTKLILTGAFVFALLTGLGAVSVIHALDRTVRSKRDVRRHLDLDCLAVFPQVGQREFKSVMRKFLAPYSLQRDKSHLGSPTPDFRGSESNFNNSLRELRIALMSGETTKTPRIIGVMSTAAGEGKSVIACNLAAALAQSGRKTVLIDADPRTCGLTHMLESDTPTELSQGGFRPTYNTGDLPGPDGYVFLPAAQDRDGDGVDLALRSGGLHGVLDRFRLWDYILLDLPAVTTSSDFRAFAPLLESVLFVVEAGRCGFVEINEALDTLSRTNIKIEGIVLNKQTDMEQAA